MIILNSDNLVNVTGLQYSDTLAYINDATVTGKLMSLDETVLATFSLSYVAASNGNYTGVLLNTVADDLTDSQEYIVEITILKDAWKEVRREQHNASWRGFN